MGGPDAKVTDVTNVLREIDVICFDLFGTLIEITDRRRPFAQTRSARAMSRRDPPPWRARRAS